MAILSGPLNIEEPHGPDAKQPVWSEDLGTMTATWIAPDETQWPLSNTAESPGWFTMDGPSGWGAPPYEIVTDPLGAGGESVRAIRQKGSHILWPIYIGGRNHVEFCDRWNAVVDAITMTSEMIPGRLRVERPVPGGARWREIPCFYEDGLGGEPGENHLYAKPVVQLYAPGGLWSGDRSIRATKDYETGSGGGGGGGGGGGKSFYAPFMTVSSSKVTSAAPAGSTEGGGGGADGPTTDIVNPGTVDAWPVWKIRGPLSKITATNTSTGERFAVTYDLLDKQVMVITTARGSVRGPGDISLARYVDWFNPSGTKLWPVRRGLNKIAFQIDGAATGTRLEFSFVPRYKTA